jgi:S-adenosyl-L-methionine hydrolase (adenosine-forming)
MNAASRLLAVGRRYDTVSLLTDYGLDDEFAGVVKSVIRELTPHATTVDLTHGIRPFDVRAGSLALARAIPYVAEGIVLAVVDPGVGTSRKAIAVEVGDGAGVLVGPDNGLLAPAVALAGGATRAVELDNPTYQLEAPGATFAGRDVFAPAAAHLCNGVDLAALGTALDADLLVPGVIALPRTEPDGIHAEVLWVDRFGNCQLNVGPDELAALAVGTDGDVVTVVCGDERRTARIATTFGELAAGSVGLVLDSQGMYALALDRRSAATELALGPGDTVLLKVAVDEPTASATRVDLTRR